jgi:rare lipoprotein A
MIAKNAGALWRTLSRRAPPALALLAAVAGLAGCHRRPVAPPSGPAAGATAPRVGWTEQGLASWYGVPYHGRRAADGEIYNMYDLVAAHRTLPFQTRVRVTNLQNHRQVVVRIIDRGPFVENRIIDLSFGAARALDMVAAGVAPVRLEVLSPINPDAGWFAVQVGAFASRANAERLARRLRGYGMTSIQDYDGPSGRLYRVRVGRLAGQAPARQLAEQLRACEHLPGFVVRLDD